MDINSFALGYSAGKKKGGVELNIAYGDTPPEDTTKLWVKRSGFDDMQIVPTIPNGGANSIETLSKRLQTVVNGVVYVGVGAKIYCFGGSGKTSIEVFDPINQTIEMLEAKLPIATNAMAPAVIGTKIYLFGGYESLYTDVIYAFDTTTQTLEKLSVKLPQKAYRIASAVIGTKVYLFGGNHGSAGNYIRVFDSETQTIETLGVTLPKTLYNIASAVFDKKVYLFGGISSSPTNRIYVFDSETQTIETLATTLPFTLHGMGSAVIGTKVYLFGGCKSSNSTASDMSNAIYEFDSETQVIKAVSAILPQSAYNIGAVVIGMQVYLFGGYTGSAYLDTINVFNVEFDLATNHMIIVISTTSNLFKLLPNVTLGVQGVYIGNAEGHGEQVETAIYKDDGWQTI